MLPAEPASQGCGQCPVGMSAKRFVNCRRLGWQDEGGDGEDQTELVRRYQEELGFSGCGHVTHFQFPVSLKLWRLGFGLPEWLHQKRISSAFSSGLKSLEISIGE